MKYLDTFQVTEESMKDISTWPDWLNCDPRELGAKYGYWLVYNGDRWKVVERLPDIDL